ncbi:MAG: HAD family hydrolase [Burkholderiales bacterium]|nr:HAD family hydrolase [Burkholderiales bacterium]
MTLKAILFDVDGTLADTERDGHRIAFNRAFGEFGLDWNWDVELYGRLLEVTGGKERIRHYVENWRTDYRKPADFDELVANLQKAKTRYYGEILEAGKIPMRPGVARLLKEAKRKGLKLAVATTTTPENVTALLRFSLAPDSVEWFDVIAAGDIVPAKKPAPDIYFWALERLGLKPEECIAVEDSENGLKSSLAAGLKTVVTITEYTRDHDFSGAAAILSDLGEPDAPFAILEGNAFGQNHVDVALLEKWHS